MGGEPFLGQVPNFSSQGFKNCSTEIIFSKDKKG